MNDLISLALMAGASYVSNRDDFNRLVIPGGWGRLSTPGDSYTINSSSGFEAISFTNGNDIVISFAGTNFSSPEADFFHGNFPLAFGVLGDQLENAAKYYLDIKAANPNANITITGHSLGGGLAALIAVLFDEQAITFDQAPFNKSLMFFNDYQQGPGGLTGTSTVTTQAVAIDLKNYLTSIGYSSTQLNTYISANASNLNPVPAETVTRSGNVTNINVAGEILSTQLLENNPLVSKTGTQLSIESSHDGVSAVNLHSIALLTAFMQSGDVPGTSGGKTLAQATYWLPNLVAMFFDSNLFSHAADSGEQNFLERIVINQAGGVPPTSLAEGLSQSITPNAMVTRFTSDLWKIIEGSGNNSYNQGLLKDLTNTLITFAMQMYYENSVNALNPAKEFFTAISGGVHFDALDISVDMSAGYIAHNQVDMTKAQGYGAYFLTFLNDLDSYLDGTEYGALRSFLPYARDWYVGLDTQGLYAMDFENRGAFMLGSTGGNNLVGGSESDLIVGNTQTDNLVGGAGNDILIGAGGNDYLQGGDGLDFYFVRNGDTIDDSDGQGVIYMQGFSNLSYVTYAMSGSDLIITYSNNDSLTIKNYKKGDLGINYAPPFSPTNTIVVAAQGNYDANGNFIETPVNDIVNGTSGSDDITDYTKGNDQIFAGDGDDNINISGKDVITVDPGKGDDYITIDHYSTDLQAPATINYRLGDGLDTIRMIPGFEVNINFIDISINDVMWSLPNGVNAIYIRLKNGEGINIISSNSPVATPHLTFSDGAITLDSSAFISNGIKLGSDLSETVGGFYENLTYLYGFGGNDGLIGWTGSQTLDGGSGADTLDGGDGRDTYIFGYGYGVDSIYDYIDANGNSNTLKLVGVNSSDVLISYQGSDQSLGLVVELKSTKERVNINSLSAIDTIEFDSGAVWGAELIKTKAGEAHDDTIYGDSNGGLLIGGTGNDTLIGWNHSDIYVFNLGDGQDTIRVGVSNNPGEVDQIRFGNGIGLSNITFSNSNDDLIIKIGSESDQITVEDWFMPTSATGFKIDFIQFYDGTQLDAATINSAALIKYGTVASDNITGTTFGNDTIYGLAGNDTIFGLGGDDSLYGGDGDDVLIGDTGSDVLKGGAGNDSLYATTADPWAMDSSSNILEGGTGDDALFGSVGSDTYIFNLGDGADTINEYLASYSNPDALDRIVFGAGIGSSDVNVVKNASDLILKIGSSGDQITVKNWADGDWTRIEQVVFADGTIWDKAFLQSAWFRIDGTESSDYLYGTNDNDKVYGLGGDDVLYGFGGDDLLDGGAGQDEIYGDEGADTLIGGTGDDRLFGGNGADTYVFRRGDGSDFIQEEGEDGAIDTIRFEGGINPQDLKVYTFQSQDMVLYLGNGDSIQIGSWFSDARYQIERFEFSDGTVLTKSQLPTLLTTPLVQNGTSGDDLLKAIKIDAVNQIYAGDGNDTIVSSLGTAYLDGGAGNDTFQLGNGINTVVGGLGNDTFFDTMSSDDTYVFNVGDGIDTIYEASKGSINDRIVFGPGLTISNLSFQQIDSDLIINVGTGADQIIIKNWFYGARIETVKFANGSIFNLLTGSPDGGDVFGSSGNDIVLGFNGDDSLYGQDGTDVLIGGAGNDTYIVDTTTDSIIEVATGGVDTVQSSVSYTLGSNLENLTLIGTTAINGTGNSLNNVLIGNGANNTLNGGAGNDTLDGGAGVDTLIGGGGDDTYIVDTTTDLITEYSGGGTDTVKSSVTYTLGSYIENLTLTGTANLNGFGNTLNNIIVGNSGSNTLNGFGGVDTLIGGAGDDVYIVDTTTDIIIENAYEGIDTVRSDVSYVLGANIENLILVGNAISGTGNALSNAITGNAYDNILDGGDGNDYLVGGDGNDTYIVDTIWDTLVETATGGIDTVKSSVTYSLGTAYNVENLTLTGTSAINGTGNSLSNFLLGNSANNTLTDTSGGNDILQGLGGADTFNDTSGNNLLDGGIGADLITAGSGNDLIIGGTGNDTITTGNGYDVILFNKGDGADTINASVGTDNTLSLGGNFAYSDLSLSKSSAGDLILKMGTSDQIIFKGWYDTATNNKSILNLQVIAESMQGFSLGSSDALRNNKVETFNFANLVAAFDAAGATSNWQFTDARLTAHLSSGSDTAAIGGDIAYQYGKAGSLTGFGLLAAQAVLNNASVGQSAQTLNASSSWSAETIKLS